MVLIKEQIQRIENLEEESKPIKEIASHQSEMLEGSETQDLGWEIIQKVL